MLKVDSSSVIKGTTIPCWMCKSVFKRQSQLHLLLALVGCKKVCEKDRPHYTPITRPHAQIREGLKI